MQKATLKTIAEYTGLSVTTVSRALKDGEEVKPHTKEVVKNAAKKLGYRPNQSGIGLRTGINYNIGAVLPVPKPGDIFGDVGTLALVEGFTFALKGTPYNLIVLPMLPGVDPLEPVKHAVENNLCGGLIINQTKAQDDRVSYLHHHDVPFVTFGRTEMSIEHPYVDIDNMDLAYKAACRLIERGCKNIKILTFSSDFTYVWHLYYGARRAALEAGLTFEMDSHMIFDVDIDNYRTLGAEIMQSDDRPDGVICGSEISACGFAAGIHDAGMMVGKDVQLVLVETSDLPTYFVPQITGYRQDFHQVGRKLVDYLLRSIKGEPAAALQSLIRADLYERD